MNHLIVQDPDAFRDLRERWDALNAAGAFPSLFMTWEWQFNWWRTFGGKPFIILIREGNEDVAILPFIAEEKYLFTQLNPIGSPHSDYLGFLIRKGEEKRTGRYFFKSFLPENPRIGVVVFDSVNERSPLTQWFDDAGPAFPAEGAVHSRRSAFPGLGLNFFRRGSGFRKVFMSKSVCPYLPLPGSFDACMANLTRKTRYFIGRKARRIEKDFAVNVGVVQSRGELGERMEQFFEQHQAIWTARGRPGAFHDDAFRNFHRKQSKRLFDSGHLKLFYMDLDGKPVASYYLFQYNRDLLFYLSGFDPAFARYSPGAVLLGRIIRDAIENNCREFDFMRGSTPYKFKWSDRTRTNQSFWLVRMRPSTLGYVLGRWMLRRAAAFLKRNLSRRTKRIFRKALPQWVIRSCDEYFRG